MTVFHEFGADKRICISSESNIPTHHDGFIMLKCMSALVG